MGGPGAPAATRLKIRIGIGLGARTTVDPVGFAALVDALEGHRFDSLWLSERISGPAPDPIVGMAFAAGRTRHLKLGTSVLVLPGRNPVVLAKELATLDRLCGGRLLPAFGLGVADPQEQAAFGIAREDRASTFDEALRVLRAAWSQPTFDHSGPRYDFRGLRVEPKPLQHHLDVWLGGIAPSELRRTGRLGDGWLPSLLLPADAERGRAVIEEVAAEHGRAIDPQHFGALIPYATGEVPDAVLAGFAARRRDLPDPSVLVPRGWDALARRIAEFVAVGTSKFVVVPVHEPAGASGWEQHLDEAAAALLPLQT